MGNLAWRNMGLYIGSDDLLQPWLDSSTFLQVFRIYLISAVATIGAFCAVSHLWAWLGQKVTALFAYSRLSELPRFIFCCHTVFVLVLAEQLVPYSIMAVRILYGNFLVDLNALYQPVFAFVLQKAILYLIEACVRGVSRVSYLLIAHHLFYFSLLITPFAAGSIFGIKVAIILDWHVVFEVLLYVALLLSRLRAPARIVRSCIAPALGLYLISRIVQTMQLCHLFVAGFSPMKASGPKLAVYWFSFTISLALSGIQCYTFYIYGNLYVRCGQRPAIEPSSRARASRRQRRPVPRASGELQLTPAPSGEIGNTIRLSEDFSKLEGGMCPAGSASLYNTQDLLLDRATSGVSAVSTEV